ncbi:ABC transporter ATP-binding protein [Vaginisenegalia massiliensis]|uniref:ABC transporter ATP-binding protein n=1 Tax=Vaginisenegalia massiliensis TaxID=2058294 RepID=UPI000F5300DA|nr:ATP-binding cassette domain-containing protein [Vaginisenegalia massiliensis]
MKEMIKFEHVMKLYDKKPVVNVEHLVIEKGQIYGLIGPNGAGKSTIMKMICGLQETTKGQVTIQGKAYTHTNRHQIVSQIGSLIEAPSYYEHLSGFENLKIVCQLKNLPIEEVDKALEEVGLSQHKHKKVKNYSLGMKQRIGIAMALIGRPPLIILDEPTNGLDPQAKEEIRHLIRDLPAKYGSTVMVSSHALDEIERMVTQIGIIGQGKLLYQGTIDNFKQHQSRAILMRTSDNQLAASIMGIPNVIMTDGAIKFSYVDDNQIASYLKKLVKANIEVYRIYEEHKSLEELFIEFTHDLTLTGGRVL